MIDIILHIMEVNDFDRCVWESDWENLIFFDRKDHDPFYLNEAGSNTVTRSMWESLLALLIKNKIKSFEFKLK